MKIHTLPRWRTKESRSSFELFLYGLLCLGVAACGGGDDPTDVDADDPCQATSSISLGQSRPGQLDATDCVLSDGLSPDGAFGDRWSLSLSGQIDVRIDLTSNTFDAFLELRDDVGNVIALNDNAPGSFDSRLIRTLQAGSYIILVRTLVVGQAGAYRLSVTDGPDCSPVGALELGQTVTGELADDDCVGESTGQVDNWSLSLPNTLKLRIDLESSDFDELVGVQDQEGNITGALVGPSGHARLDIELGAGEWTILATSLLDTGRGAYDLTVGELPACTPGTDFVLGETVAGDISPSDCLFAFVAPADSFVINITEETVISIHLKSLDFQPFVILLDAKRDRSRPRPGRDGGRERTDSRSPQPGFVRPVCDDCHFVWRGQLSAHREPDRLRRPTNRSPSDRPWDGALDDNDCLRSGGAFQESWELVLANDTTARIDLESAPAFDAFLVLKDSDGTILAEDDDGSGGLDARIERALTAGTYEIVASSRNANETGAYQLKVDVPPLPTSTATGTERARAP